MSGAVYIDNFILILVDIPDGCDPDAPTEPIVDDDPQFDPEDSIDGIQMVYNSSFEEVDIVSGKVVGYDHFLQYDENYTAPTISINTDPTYVHTGSNSIRLTSSDQAAFVCVAPRVYLIPGATYTVSYWVKGETSKAMEMGLVFGVVENGSPKDMVTNGVERQSSPVSPENERWQNHVCTFVAPNDRDYVSPYVSIP